MSSGDESKVTVKLPSGKEVVLPRTECAQDAHTPAYLLAWLEKHGDAMPVRMREFKRRICVDRRMAEFWEWLGSIRFARLDNFRSSLTVSDRLYRSTKLPGKPGDMTPVQREAYFKRVRSHAEALQALLEGTRFDNPYMTEISDAQLEKPLGKALYDWGEDEEEEGHVVAFQVTRDGRFQHHYAYPDNVLTETLFELIAWTYWDDGWDGGIWSTSAPIAQANSESTPAIYFCCTVYDWFKERGVEVPFRVLATAAGVALALPPEKQLDEDAVRKQVRRYQDRMAKQRAERPNAFDEPSGQNFQDDGDSVLSDPF